MNFEEGREAILDFIATSRTSLNNNDESLRRLIEAALKYLVQSENVQGIGEQKKFLKDVLIPEEKRSDGRFSFVLEHDVSRNSEHIIAPRHC